MSAAVEVAMQDSPRSAALHAALRFVITNDSLAEHKSALIDALLQALRDDDDAAALHRRTVAQTYREWQDDEIVQLKSSLQDRVALSWQDADECVMHLAAQLTRDPRSVRDKVLELGLGAAVDYRLAFALRHERGR